MQCAVIEFARNVCNLSNSNSKEFDSQTKYPVIDLMPSQKKVIDKGATMRLGKYSCSLSMLCVLTPIFCRKTGSLGILIVYDSLKVRFIHSWCVINA